MSETVTGTDSEPARVGVAIFGVGRMGKCRLQALVSETNAKILWLIDLRSQRRYLEAVVEKYRLEGEAKVTSLEHSEEVLSDPRVKAVFVCTTPKSHVPLVVKAIESGKAVFCEKPIGLSETLVRLCYDAADKNKQILYCAFNKRKDPSVRKMYDDFKEGKVGDLRLFKSCCRDPDTNMPSEEYVKDSGGMFWDSIIHDLDLALWFANQVPLSLAAFGSVKDPLYAKYDDVDTACVVLTFPDGAIAVIDNSRGATYGYDQRFEMLGTKGALLIENPTKTSLQSWTSTGIQHDLLYADTVARFPQSYTREVIYFLDVIQGKEPYTDDSWQVILGAHLANLCTQARKTGQVLPVTYKR